MSECDREALIMRGSWHTGVCGAVVKQYVGSTVQQMS